MTDNGGGQRDSGAEDSWFRPSENRYRTQSDYQDPLEGEESGETEESVETVFPDSGGYAGLSSSRPALVEPYPEALGGPPHPAPPTQNGISYPGAGSSAYQPLTRAPGEPKESILPSVAASAQVPLPPDDPNEAPADRKGSWDTSETSAGQVQAPVAGADTWLEGSQTQQISALGGWDTDVPAEGRNPAGGDTPSASGHGGAGAPDADAVDIQQRGANGTWRADTPGAAHTPTTWGDEAPADGVDGYGPTAPVDDASTWSSPDPDIEARDAGAVDGHPWDGGARGSTGWGERDADAWGGGSAVGGAQGADTGDRVPASWNASSSSASETSETFASGANGGQPWEADPVDEQGIGTPVPGSRTWDDDTRGPGARNPGTDELGPSSGNSGVLEDRPWDSGPTDQGGPDAWGVASGTDGADAPSGWEPDMAPGVADEHGADGWSAAPGAEGPAERVWSGSDGADVRSSAPTVGGEPGVAPDGRDPDGWDVRPVSELGVRTWDDGGDGSTAWGAEPLASRTDDYAPDTWSADPGLGPASPVGEDRSAGWGAGEPLVESGERASRSWDTDELGGDSWSSGDTAAGWDDELSGGPGTVGPTVPAGAEGMESWTPSGEAGDSWSGAGTKEPWTDGYDDELSPSGQSLGTGTGNTWAFDRNDPRLPDVVREAEQRRREAAAEQPEAAVWGAPDTGELSARVPASEDPLAAIADMQSRARSRETDEDRPEEASETGLEHRSEEVSDGAAQTFETPAGSEEAWADEGAGNAEYDDGFTPADYGLPETSASRRRRKDPIADDFPGFNDRPLGGELGDPYPGYESIDFLADTERGATVTLWLGIASLIPGVGLVTAILALLVTGPKSKKAVRESRGQLDGLGFITMGTVFAVFGILVTVISVALWLLL